MDATEFVGSSGTFLNAKQIAESNLEGIELTIEKVETRDLNDTKKLVLSFEGREELLALNKTNANIMVEKYGKETDGWIKKKVDLMLVKVKYQGSQVDSIQIKTRS